MAPSLMLFSCRQGDAPSAGIGIRLLNPTKKIIPIYYQYDPIWHSDVKLPLLVVENKSGEEIFLESCVIIGKAGGGEVIRTTIGKERIAAYILKSAEILNELLKDPGNPWMAYNTKKMFGNISEKGKFGEKNPLRPGEKACLSFGDMMTLHYAGPDKVDEMSIRVSARSSGNELSADFPVVLTSYACKGNYIFPVPGSVTIGMTPVSGSLSCLSHAHTIPGSR